MIKQTGSMPSNMVFLHADALDLPFQSDAFAAIISLNLLHMFEDENVVRVLQGIKEMLQKNGKLAMTTLVQTGRWSDRYLRMWANKGELVQRNPQKLMDMFQEEDIGVNCRIQGNLAIIRSR